MLEDTKNSYIECANLIPNWRDLSISELANLYVESDDDTFKNSCFSALMCKHWKMIGMFYYKQGIKSASEIDCHDWVVDGILGALQDRVWLNPNNSLYNDPKGPEKAMNVFIRSTRANYYQFIAYDKRSLNYNSLSLDALEENSSDGYYLSYQDQYSLLNEHVKELVVDSFNKKDYFLSFFYDAVFNSVLLDDCKEKNNLSMKKINKYIANLSEEDLKNFSDRYSLDFESVKKSIFYINNMPSYKIQYNTTRAMNTLKNDNILYDLLKDEK